MGSNVVGMLTFSPNHASKMHISEACFDFEYYIVYKLRLKLPIVTKYSIKQYSLILLQLCVCNFTATTYTADAAAASLAKWKWPWSSLLYLQGIKIVSIFIVLFFKLV